MVKYKLKFAIFLGVPVQKLVTATTTNNQMWEAQDPWFTEMYVYKSLRGGGGGGVYIWPVV